MAGIGSRMIALLAIHTRARHTPNSCLPLRGHSPFHRAVLLASFRERDRQPEWAETPARRVAAIEKREARGEA